MTDLSQQIALEAEELSNAPSIPVSQLRPVGNGAGRCNWCGHFDTDLVMVEPGRYKGVNCCGQRHL